MKAGEVFCGRFAAQDAIAANRAHIMNSSAKTGVSPAIYQAIMYEENAHQVPPFGGERAFENAFPGLSKGGVGVMQVSAKTSGLPNSALLDDSTNVNAAGSILQGIQSRYGNDAATMGGFYNSGAYGTANTRAANYGQRVSSYANSNLTVTFGDRVVRGAASASAGAVLGSLYTALTTLSSVLKAMAR